MGWLIVLLGVGDLVVLALWLRERRAHRMSRRALNYWRDLAGLRQVPLKSVDEDMAAQLKALRSQEPNRIRLAPPRVSA